MVSRVCFNLDREANGWLVLGSSLSLSRSSKTLFQKPRFPQVVVAGCCRRGAVQSPGLKLHHSKRGMTITRRRFWLLSLSCNFSVPKYFMYSSRSFKLSCMDGQVDYPGQTLSCPNEKDCEPSHVNLCLLGTQGCPLICRRSSLFKQLVFGVQSVKVVRKPCKR